MKRISTLIAVMLLIVSVFAQAPQKMSYQAVIRNSSDQLVTDHAVGMKISILQGSASGSVIYTETQTPTANANGLVSIEIGGSNGFDAINWSNGSYFIKTETDPSGLANYTITGVSQILSVPYALHAETAESLTGALDEADPSFTAWDKSTGISIVSSQISDLQTSIKNNPDVLANTAKNSYPIADAAKLAAITGTNTGDQDINHLATIEALRDSIALIRSLIPTYTDSSETKLSAGTNITITGIGTAANPYTINSIDTSKLIFVLSGDITDAEAAQRIKNEVGQNTKYIYVFMTSQLTSISFDGVSELLDVKIHDNSALTAIDFKDLEFVGEFTIERDPLLSSLNIGSLKYSTGINIVNTNLSILDIPNIESIIQSLNLYENPKLISVSLNKIKSIGQGVNFVRNPLLYSFSSSSLQSISNISNHGGNPVLSQIDIGNISTPCTFELENCALSSETINNILSKMVSIIPAITDKYIILNGQNPPAPPTGQGIIDKATLISNGNIVHTD